MYRCDRLVAHPGQKGGAVASGDSPELEQKPEGERHQDQQDDQARTDRSRQLQ